MQELLEQHKLLLAQVDAWFARCMELHPDKIACRTGCSSCCRALFDITLVDAYYLKLGFDALAQEKKEPVLQKCRERLQLMREAWPGFEHPFLLNTHPEEEWEELMPEEDETPCVLLGDDGRCLVYDNRPMTCRLHGIPFIDTSGDVLHDEWCTMNFLSHDPLELEDISAPFDSMFAHEVDLFRQFTQRLVGKRMSQLDTFIPTALLIDFSGFDWGSFIRTYKAAE